MNAQHTPNSMATTLDNLAHAVLGSLGDLAGVAVIVVAFLTAFPMA